MKRSWKTQQVADTKKSTAVVPLFSKDKEIARNEPSILISDQAPKVRTAFNKELWTKRIQEVDTSIASGYQGTRQ